MRWTITETDNKRNFLSTKFLVTDFFITERRNVLMYTARIGLSREKYYYLGKVRNLGFSFRICLLPLLENFERHYLLEIWIFSVLQVAIIRENLDKRPWTENGQRFAIHLLRGDLCKSGSGYFASEKSLPSNFAQ